MPMLAIYTNSIPFQTKIAKVAHNFSSNYLRKLDMQMVVNNIILFGMTCLLNIVKGYGTENIKK